MVGGEARQRRRVWLRQDPAPLARAEDAEHERAEPGRGQDRPDEVQAGSLLDGASAILRVRRRMISTTTTSPAKTQRHEKYVVQNPPISGPTATAIAPAAATRP